MQAFLDAIPLPALLISAQERIVAANDEIRAILGNLSPEAHVTTALRQPRVLAAIEAVLADGTSRETRFQTSSVARDSHYTVTVRPVTLPGGRGALAVFQDVTQLEQAVEMRRDFVANVSHELRTPLTALIGFIETLRTSARDDPKARERFLGIMAAEAGRMNRLVGDLLSLNRVEDEARVRPREQVFLPELVRSAVAGMSFMAEDHGATLLTDLPAETFAIPADPDQLRQVLGNLIENAIKYGGKGVTVTVSLSAPAPHGGLGGQAVELTVADTGPGIEARHLPRLTERFYRIDNHRSREMGGTGLGLAIVKHIVSRHRGRLKIDSEPGKGTRFRVILPAA